MFILFTRNEHNEISERNQIYFVPGTQFRDFITNKQEHNETLRSNTILYSSINRLFLFRQRASQLL